MKISFESQGQKIAGNLFRGHDSKPAFLFIQGWTGHQNLLAAQALADAGHTVLTYDMRGHGDSEGNLANLSRADFINDAALAYDFLKHQAKPKAIGIVGSSFGGYTAIHLSARRLALGLSLRVPANYPEAGFNDPQLLQVKNQVAKDFWQKQILDVNQNDSLAILHRFDSPIQIIEAEHDEIIPHQTIQNYVDAVANPSKLDYVVMKNAPHSLRSDALQFEYRNLLLNWVKGL